MDELLEANLGNKGTRDKHSCPSQSPHSARHCAHPGHQTDMSCPQTPPPQFPQGKRAHSKKSETKWTYNCTNTETGREGSRINSSVGIEGLWEVGVGAKGPCRQEPEMGVCVWWVQARRERKVRSESGLVRGRLQGRGRI